MTSRHRKRSRKAMTAPPGELPLAAVNVSRSRLRRTSLGGAWATLIATAIVILVAVFFVRHRSRSRPSAQAGASSGYVDSEVCEECHGAIAETYRKTGMGRSFY